MNEHTPTPWRLLSEELLAALEKIAGGHGIPDDLLERALTDKGLLYGWCQSVARAALANAKKRGRS